MVKTSYNRVMIKRRNSKTANVGSIKLGGSNPIVLQSMTKVATTDVAACLGQIAELREAGCGLVRLAVPTKADTAAFAKIVNQCDMPLVADIHFSRARAIEAIEAGAAKIRLNPGNLKERADILEIIEAAKAHGTAIRVGVNEASIRDLRAGDVAEGGRVGLMLEEMSGYVRVFEEAGFENIVLSAKSADTVRTIEINRLMAEKFEYPIHLGLTHAGLVEDATVSSSVAIGTLLAEGIGDTIRVSVAGDPLEEIRLGREILASLGLAEKRGPELIVCPTCGRCQIDVVALARKVRGALENTDKKAKVAVMGCIVNGPGEAADADVAVCAAKGKGFLYSHGKKLCTVPEDQLLDSLVQEIDRL
ncbi:4-hydroxy-3-methylbut-2-en-1-yl diphosphate synthase [Anaerohalosphaera lusitana]|uniref:4-hydroxy-3-methylbut-2-en-1-yl diphosphate synthase (flavodoxin) n=1 Tax=Anaerohalosphaera lusitana TaxID=1936003 RepID=A0A1U9NQ01_9BACT|nr:flavodoxin-dependent (E)-4-hydroxy-3-methylbut-2-enyl-diphosphate synthase [Anaerohalosphaera lusitana]AQT70011.1 4-hydroxy-3-methylbut-2-en-1-yl diphosphate synthase [Anaerohalosphaera lusitana]